MRFLLMFVAITTLAACGPAPEVEKVEATQAAVVAGDTYVNQHSVYSGIWAPSSAGQFLGLGRNYDQFVAEYGTWWNNGYRLISLTTNVINGQAYYSGVWNPSTSGQFLGLGRNYDQFVAEYGTWWNNGFRLIALSTYVLNNVTYYNGVWNPSTSGQFLGLGRNYDQFVAEYGTWWNNGFRLIALTSNVINGVTYYNGVWNPSTSGQFLGLGRTHSQFISENTTWTNNGYRLAALSTHVVNNVLYYNGVWNPSSSSRVLGLGQPEPDFLSTYNTQWGANRRLIALVANTEGLGLNQMAQHITNGFSGNAVGYTATIGSGATRKTVAGGLRRTTADYPSRSSSNSARVNVASVSKTVTATAVLQLLATKGLTLNSKMSGYLPSDWTRGTNISTISFGELLTHRSGLRGANANATSYTDLKTLIAGGINLANKTFSYQNQNFALFRIIIPYLNGFNEAGVTNKDTATSAAYMSYMNTKVFAPAGISTVSMKPTTTEPTLCYPLPAGSINGTHFGDWTGLGGGAGLQLSSNDLATFLVKLRDGTLLTPAWRDTMDTNLAGWGGKNNARHGSVFDHGGYLFMPTANGNAEINTMIFNFTTGVQVGLEVNSRTNANTWQTVVNAYNNSWAPLN